ncbi:unnamed protein product [Diamesa hyperborea]
MANDCPITKNIVIVGDGTVGKTCLLHSFTNDTFLESYVPTVYDKEVFELTLDNVTHSIKLHDTAGQEEYDRVRKLFYGDADCFILCYSIDNKASFQNIWQKWLHELRSIDRLVPIVLVGTKTDLRQNLIRKQLITTEEGESLKRRIHANTFIECSAKDNILIKETVYEAVRASVNGAIIEEENVNSSMFSCCQS